MTSTVNLASAVQLARHNQRNYQITWLATFLFFVAFYALIVPLPRYLTGIGLADWQVGFVLGATSIASPVARPISGLLTDRFGYKPILLFGAGSLVVGTVGVVVSTGVMVLFGIGFGAYFQFFAVLLERRAISAAPIYATYGVTIIVTRLLFGRYLDRIGFARVIFLGALLMAFGLAVAAVGDSTSLLMVAAALTATGGGFFHPMLIAHHVTILPERPGWAVACFYFGFDAGLGVGAWVLGIVLGLWGLAALFWTAAGFTLATMLLLPLMSRQQRTAT
ncbi:MAG TPA: MFS transporter [Caldilineaceae bacterium]|nr:MFS transporter [Caldilineaceae bacterium]